MHNKLLCDGANDFHYAGVFGVQSPSTHPDNEATSKEKER